MYKINRPVSRKKKYIKQLGNNEVSFSIFPFFYFCPCPINLQIRPAFTHAISAKTASLNSPTPSFIVPGRGSFGSCYLQQMVHHSPFTARHAISEPPQSLTILSNSKFRGCPVFICKSRMLSKNDLVTPGTCSAGMSKSIHASGIRYPSFTA